MFDYEQAFCRNNNLCKSWNQDKIRQAKVAVIGCGGVGGLHAMNLARMGIENIILVDPDVFELSNLNRQYGSSTKSVGRHKVVVVKRDIVAINPEAKVDVIVGRFCLDNASDIIHEVDIIIDGLDVFSFQARLELYRTARAYGKTVINSGPFSFGAGLIVFGKDSMAFEDYFDIHDCSKPIENFVKLCVGMTPSLMYLKYVDIEKIKKNMFVVGGPCLNATMMMAASFVGTEVVRHILEPETTRYAPYSLHYDAYRRKIKHSYLPKGNRGWLQKIKINKMVKRIHVGNK